MAGEAERIIESLRPMGIEDVGTEPWMEQRGWIEKLNLQACFARPENSLPCLRSLGRRWRVEAPRRLLISEETRIVHADWTRNAPVGAL